jgi:L-iditol 2-dehydrogenase
VHAAVLHAIDDIRLDTVADPEPGPGEVLVKVGANTICGTDLRIMRGEKTTKIHPPTILGHEIAGTVAALGAGVSKYEVGSPVGIAPVIPCGHCGECERGIENLCSEGPIFGYDVGGGMAEYVLAPALAVDKGVLVPATVDLPPEQLALAEPLSCVVNGQQQVRVGLGDRVLVMGAGPIGLFHVQLALINGADQVIVSEPDALRRDTALRFGAAAAVDPLEGDGAALKAAVQEATDGRGVDVAIVCVGNVPGLVGSAIDLSRLGGRVSIFAGLKDPHTELDGNKIHYGQITLSGAANSGRDHYRKALRLIETGRIDTAAMITHRYGLDSVVEAIETVPSNDTIKVAVVPGLEGGGKV